MIILANWNKENVVITKLGSKLISYAAAGFATIELTRVVVRDTVSTVLANYNYTLADITDIKQAGRLLKKAGGVGEDSDTTLVSVRFSNSELPSESTTFNIRQIVLLAQLTDISITDPDFVNPGEVPFLVAQSEGLGDYDLMPPKASSPTTFDYDLYILHTGVPTITVSIQSTGYVHETEFNGVVTQIEGDISNLNTEITNVKNNLVGQHTQGKNFKEGSWLPVYTESTNDDGFPVVTWSTTDSILPEEIFQGKKSAERFNLYEEYDEENPDIVANIAVGYYCHAEGSDNLILAYDSHVEGNQNYAGYALDDDVGDVNHNANKGSHVEGTQNTAADGWGQHIEGAINYSTGYCSHIEGSQNINYGIVNHIEGLANKIVSGGYNHVTGQGNVLSGGDNNVVEGFRNSLINSSHAHVGGLHNNVTSSPYTVVFGNGNTATVSNSNFIFGSGNTASQNTAYTAIFGYGNSAYNSTYNIISGLTNIVDQTYNSVVFGHSNRLNSGVTRSSVGGESNAVSKEVLSESHNNSITGFSNTLSDMQDTIAAGAYNDVQYAMGSAVVGIHNTVALDVYEGSKTNSRGITYSFIGGAYNEVKQTESSIVVGSTNKIKDYRPHGIPSEWRLSSFNSVSGDNNTANGLYSTVLSGHKNTISNIHDSIIGGSTNTIDGLDTPASGYSNSVLCMALRSNVQNHYEPQIIFGSDNVVKGNNSLTSGIGLKSSSNNSATFGKFNEEDTLNTYAFVIGGGTADNNRSNIATIDWVGNLDVHDISVGSIDSLVEKIAEIEEAIQRLTPSEE